MHPADCEDFWSRKPNRQRHQAVICPLGVETRISANQESVLSAARITASRFSRGAASAARPIRIRIIVTPDEPGPVPSDLPDKLRYQGCDDWITLSAGAWGYGFADLRSRQACLVLSRSLAAETWLVSRYFLDHYVTNLLFADFAMLHASSVFTPHGGRLVVLVGPHGVGKSTTALELAQDGYRFVADGMVLFRFENDDLVAGGWPVGEAKLRDDMATRFPELSGRRVMVRGRPKNVVDLLEAAPDRVWTGSVRPETTDLVCVERDDTTTSRIDPAPPEHVIQVVSANTVYWDEPSRLEPNSRALERLADRARTFRLRVGSPGNDAAKLLAAHGI